MRKARLFLTVPLVAVALVFPLVGKEGYFTHLAITMMIFSMLAASLNVLIGYAGLVSIAHGAFFGIGAYAAGILTARYGIAFWSALAAATLVTALVAFGIGVPSFRTRGIYYIIVTVAFQLIVTEVFDGWYAMTGGGLGLRGIPRPSPLVFPLLGFESKVAYYYLVMVVALVVHYSIIRVIRSPLGISLMAIRDNETKALMMGLNPLHYKTFAFVFAASVAGVAGSLYAHYVGYVHPDFFNFAVSTDLFLAVMLGGAGTVYGPFFGVAVLEVTREILHEFLALRLFVFGVLLVAFIIFLPGGILGPLAEYTRQKRNRLAKNQVGLVPR